MHWIERPELPEGPVSALLAGAPWAPLLAPGLAEYGVSVLPVPENPRVAAPVRGHADLSVCYLGGGELAAAFSARQTLERLPGAVVLPAAEEQGPRYPADTLLNAAIVGNRALICERGRDDVLYAALLRHGMVPVPVKQGYARCSVCIVSQNAAMTADRGIARALEAYETDVLVIEAGHVELPGYAGGFLGGCCGKISRDKLAFTGRLDEHPDKRSIMDFLERHGVEPVFLTDRPCFDVGSLLPVMEWTEER